MASFLKLLLALLLIEIQCSSNGIVAIEEGNSSWWEKHISKLINFHFSVCSLLFVKWDPNPNDRHRNTHQLFPAAFDSSDEISSVSNTIFYKLKWIQTSFQIRLLPNLNYNTTGTKTAQRKNSDCKLVLTLINSRVDMNFSDLFFDKLTPSQNELTKRDEDYYIFITKNHHVAETVLDSRIFSQQLRHKITIQQGDTNKSPVIRTACFHCPDERFPYVQISRNRENIFPDFTRNFHQSQIRLTGPSKYMAAFELEKTNGMYKFRRGIDGIYLKTVTRKLNMTFTIQYCKGYGKVPEGVSGLLLPNGEWAGCMRDILQNVSDWSVLVGTTSARYGLVHFSPAIYYGHVIFITAKPQLYYPWTTIASAFSFSVWVPVTVSVILVSITFYLTQLVLSPAKYAGISTFVKIQLHLFGYLIGQDMTSPSQSQFSSKLLHFFWLFYGLVISAAYASSLQALIVSPGLEPTPRSLEELVRSKYTAGAPPSISLGVAKQLFQFSENPALRKVYAEMKPEPNTASCDMKALGGKYACVNWEKAHLFNFRMTFADHSGYYPFLASREALFSVPCTHISRKRELFATHFNDFFRWSFAMGLWMPTFDKDWGNYRTDIIKGTRNITLNPIASKHIPFKLKSFGFQNVKGSFIIFAIGVFVCFVCFMIERLLIRQLLST